MKTRESFSPYQDKSCLVHLIPSRDDEIPIDHPSMTGDTYYDDRNPGASSSLQTFVLSATLSKGLQRNLKKRTWPKSNKKRRNKDDNSSSTLGIAFPLFVCQSKVMNIADDLLLRLDFRDPEPSIIDLSPQGNVVPTLQEAKIECLANHKVILVLTGTEMKYSPIHSPGCLSILLPSPASRSFTRLFVIYRRYSTPHASSRTSRY